MITPLPELRESTICADVCLVGAGPVGLDLAAQSADAGQKVVLIEGGGASYDEATQALHAIVRTGCAEPAKPPAFASSSAHPAAGESRVRQLGGTGNIWTGKWKLPGDAEFSDRAWMTSAGWPISRDDLLPHCQAVLHDYGIPDLVAAEQDLQAELSKQWQAHTQALRPTLYFEQSKGLDFAGFHRARLTDDDRIRLITHANVTGISGESNAAFTGAKSRVAEITARSLCGAEVRIEAERFVLCCGGIETPRLLMLAEGLQLPQSDWIGRGYMDHPKAIVGEFVPTRRKKGKLRLPENQHQEAGMLCTGFELSAEAQAAEACGNHLLLIRPGSFAKPSKSLWNSIRKSFHPFATHVATLHLESPPRRESYVSLSDKRDALGLPLPRLHWPLDEPDLANAQRFLARVQEDLHRGGFGTLRLDRNATEPSRLSQAHHPMGTARMAERPEDGVVDENCRVFGIDNLWVAGSAVFPVGGNANPTLLILALARRLAAQLS